MKRLITDIIIILVIVGLAFSTYVNGKIVDVTTYQARKGKVTSIVRVDGDISTKEEKEIYYKKDCIITEFMVSEGQEVRVGDPVFKIDLNYDALAVDTQAVNLNIQLETEKNQLESLLGGKYAVDKKRLDLLKTELDKLEKDHSDSKVLYDSGVITQVQLDQAASLLASKKIAYDEALSDYTSKVSSSDLEVKKLQESIRNIEKQLAQIEAEKTIYSSVDDEGVYYSEHRGVVKHLAPIGAILDKKTALLSFAITGSVEAYKFVGYVDAEYGHLISDGDEIDFYDGVINEPLKGRVLKVYNLVENGKIQVDGEFLEDRAAKISYGKQFYSEKIIEPISEIVIPKNCVIGSDDYQVGDDVSIYIVEDELAKKIRVNVEAIGDSMLGITVDAGLSLNEIIVDPSYKVKDGERVR